MRTLTKFVVGLFAAGSVGCSQAPITEVRLAQLERALDHYYIEAMAYPTTAQGLQALVTNPTAKPAPDQWNGPYIEMGLLKDGWDRPFRYRCPGAHNPAKYDLWSGGDDADDPADDVRNWLH